MKKILVVDDEKDLLELISYNLKKEGFSVVVSYDGEDALSKLKNNGFDLLILDLMLPGIDGIEILRFVRSNPKLSALPVLILTAKGEEIDKILGLEMGADDYVTKPFSPRELIARVRALLRRVSKIENKAEVDEKRVLKIGDLEIDRDKYVVRVKGKEIGLSSTEFKILLYLAERRGRIFTREQLLDAIWGNEVFVEARNVDVHIRRLRQQIEEDPSNPIYLKTKRGIGYYIDADEQD